MNRNWLFILLLIPLLSAGSVYETPGTLIASAHQTGALHMQSSYRNGLMQVEDISDGSRDLGHLIYFSRKDQRIKAKYFAQSSKHHNSVYDRYSSWHSSKDVALLCSGAFSTDNDKATGLTVDNGVLINREIDPEMDALVVVYATGGVAIADIEKEGIYLASLEERLYPTKPADRFKLLNWAKEEQATIFQTQLLVHSNELRLIPAKASKQKRERRILSLIKDAEGELQHVIFNVPVYCYLGDITKQLYDYFNANDAYVYGMINLDTGAYDILEVYDDDGDQLNEPRGPKNKVNATNLLIYHYE